MISSDKKRNKQKSKNTGAKKLLSFGKVRSKNNTDTGVKIT